MSETRRYNSPIRSQQAEQTRRSILDALVEVMAEGPASVTVPAVAERAGVSIPTIYRHFGDKSGLLAAIVPYIGERIGLASLDPPADLDELDDAIRRLFHHLDEADPVIRAALASGANREARRSSIDLRLSAISQVADRFGDMPPEDADHLAKVLVILTCSDALRLWYDRFDVDADDVAEHVIWAFRTLLKGAGR